MRKNNLYHNSIKRVTMKTIIVTTLALSILLLANICCSAQAYSPQTFSGSIGGEVLIAERQLSATNKTGGGFSLKGEYVFGGHASATISSGYYFMPAKNILNVKTEAVSAIPVKAGARYYLGSFYGAGEVGKIFFMGDDSRSGFVYSLGLGDKINVGNRVIDIGLRHEGWSTSDVSRGFIGLRVAYEFAINNQQSTILPAL